MLETKIDSNGALIAQIIRAKANRSGPAWEAASKHLGELWLNWAKLLSSVQYASTKALAQQGHPYARRQYAGKQSGHAAGTWSGSRLQARAQLPAPAYNVNKQTGALYGGWAVSVDTSGGDHVISLTNAMPYFRWLSRGTRFMISRPIVEVALARAGKQFPEVYDRTQRVIHGYAAD